MAEILRRGRLSLVTYDPALVPEFVENLSQANLREFRELYKADPLTELSSFSPSEFIYMVMCDKAPVAMVGIVPLDEVSGTMFALFSKDLPQHWIPFVRGSPALIKFLHSLFHIIEVHVWTENDKMHQWLSFLGFEAYSISQHPNTKHSITDFVRCSSEPPDVYARLI